VTTSDLAAIDQHCTDALAVRLERAEAAVAGIPRGGVRYRNALAELRARLLAGRLHVAVLGQFKRGKSSFLNALLGEAVLPTGVVPLTAIATFIRWAAAPSIRVIYRDDRPEDEFRTSDTAQLREQLARFVTEEGNPRNRLQVARVDLYYPAPILRQGIVLIDTPGIGSGLRHNTDAALAVLPECDAGFFILSADPPITEAELLYLDRVRSEIARLFFVLNKIDYLAPEEREAAAAFLRKSLREHASAEADVPIFSLSARQALAARRSGDAGGLARSGLAAIEHHLVAFLAREKVASLRQAIARKASAILGAALMDLALAIRALEMPLTQLQHRAAEFTRVLEDIERQRLVARDLIAGDRRRAVEALEAQARQLREEAQRTLFAVLDRCLEEGPEHAEKAARGAIAAAIPRFFEAKLGEMSRALAAAVEDILKGHVARAEALIGSVRESAASLFEISAVPYEQAESFAIRREPYWVTERWSDSWQPLGAGVVDRLLPAASRAARLKKRLAAEIDALVARNVENLRWASLQNLDSAFHRFAAWFDERLDEAIAATRGAIETAVGRRRAHAEEVRDALLQLRQSAELLQELRADLASEGAS
jgi:GTP-binding protein EngB required for normal cell division